MLRALSFGKGLMMLTKEQRDYWLHQHCMDCLLSDRLRGPNISHGESHINNRKILFPRSFPNFRFPRAWLFNRWHLNIFFNKSQPWELPCALYYVPSASPLGLPDAQSFAWLEQIFKQQSCNIWALKSDLRHGLRLPQLIHLDEQASIADEQMLETKGQACIFQCFNFRHEREAFSELLKSQAPNGNL